MIKSFLKKNLKVDITKQTIIDKKGAHTLYWATKEVKTDRGTYKVLGSASKSGTGRVVLLTTSLSHLFPFSYILKFRKPGPEFEWLKSIFQPTTWHKLIPTSRNFVVEEEKYPSFDEEDCEDSKHEVMEDTEDNEYGDDLEKSLSSSGPLMIDDFNENETENRERESGLCVCVCMFVHNYVHV